MYLSSCASYCNLYSGSNNDQRLFRHCVPLKNRGSLRNHAHCKIHIECCLGHNFFALSNFVIIQDGASWLGIHPESWKHMKGPRCKIALYLWPYMRSHELLNHKSRRDSYCAHTASRQLFQRSKRSSSSSVSGLHVCHTMSELYAPICGKRCRGVVHFDTSRMVWRPIWPPLVYRLWVGICDS